MSGPIPPNPSLYPREHPKWIVSMAVLAVVLLVVTLGGAYCAWNLGPGGLYIVYIFLAVWAILPPVWFWSEYYFLFRKVGDLSQLEGFKYGQQLSAAIWAGIVVLLLGLATSERFKSPSSPPGGATKSQTK